MPSSAVTSKFTIKRVSVSVCESASFSQLITNFCKSVSHNFSTYLIVGQSTIITIISLDLQCGTTSYCHSPDLVLAIITEKLDFSTPRGQEQIKRLGELEGAEALSLNLYTFNKYICKNDLQKR